MRILSAPLRVSLGITSKCNLNCIHCLAGNDRGIGDLSASKLLSIIKEIISLKIFNVTISGGEPLMRRDFFKIIGAFNNFKACLSLSTNATLITKDMARKLSGSHIKYYQVSLDGSSEKLHDALRGRGAFKKAVCGIKNLLDKRRDVIILTTVTNINVNDLENIAIIGKKLGVLQVVFKRLMYTGSAIKFYNDLKIRLEDRVKLFKMFKKLKRNLGEFVSGYGDWLISVTREDRNKKFPLIIDSCSAAVTRCAIRPDGWVVPCEMTHEIKAGNLKNQSLYDIWNNSPVMKEFREPIKIREEDIPECKDCRYLILCYRFARCQPYYYSKTRFKHKELYCWKGE